MQVKSVLLKVWRNNKVLFVNKMWQTTVLLLPIWYVYVVSKLKVLNKLLVHVLLCREPNRKNRVLLVL